MNRYDQIYETKINQLVLELVRRRLSQRVGQTFFQTLKFEERVSEFDHTLLRELEWQLFGTHREVAQQIKYPKDWWNALKERFFPKWLLKWFPASYTVVDGKVVVTKLCPHLNVSPQDRHIAWLADHKVLESDWKTDKRIPDWLSRSAQLLEIASNYIQRESPMLAQELKEQAKQLKEDVL